MIDYSRPPEATNSAENQSIKKDNKGKLYVAYLNKAKIDSAAKDMDSNYQHSYTGYYRSLDGESIFLVPSTDEEIMYCGYDSSEYY